MSLKKPYPLSSAQAQFLFNSVAPINICDGPVRCGKNYVENARVDSYIRSEPYADPLSWFLFAGPTKDAVLRNFLDDFFFLIGGNSKYEYNRSNGMGTIMGRPFFVAGFDDAGAFKKIQGMTLGGSL